MRRLLPLIVLLVACSKPRSGTVGAKDYDAEWLQTVPVYRTTCVKSCVSTISHFMLVWHPEQWRLRVDSADKHGWYTVSQQEWNRFNVGDSIRMPQ